MMIAKQEKERSPIFDPKTEEAIVDETLEGGVLAKHAQSYLGRGKCTRPPTSQSW